MCAICGCSSLEPGEAHSHPHGAHHHGDDRDHAHGKEARLLRLEADLLSRNDRIAQENRIFLAERGAVAFNLIGSPGAGKTSLLEALIPVLRGSFRIAVLEGDQETDLDAERIRQTGAPVLQINTGSGCHLNAKMIGESLQLLETRQGSLVFIENVGNLVCPALFDIGEHAKILVVSVTEGPDKPLKYPQIFREAQALVLNKVDLLPYLEADLQDFMENARRVNPQIRIFPVSCSKGSGLTTLLDWLSTLAHAEAEAEAQKHGSA